MLLCVPYFAHVTYSLITNTILINSSFLDGKTCFYLLYIMLQCLEISPTQYYAHGKICAYE